MTQPQPRVLVIDGYPQSDRDNLAGCGMDSAGDLYVAMLQTAVPRARFDILYPSDPGSSLAPGAQIGDYHGIAWTGCSLTIHDDSDSRVADHLELARAAFRIGVPQFGTCWGLQIAAVAAGGTVAAHPGGREMGLGRKITLSATGRGHPMYEGKPATFDGYVSHFDEVTHLPAGAQILAGNAHTRVQAANVHHQKGVFWGLQYHPEFDLFQIARLIHCRRAALVKEGFFHDEPEALEFGARLEALHAAPGDKALAWQLGVEADLLDAAVRQTEPRNWMRDQVLAFWQAGGAA